MRISNFGSYAAINEFFNAMRECERDDGTYPAPECLVVCAPREGTPRAASALDAHHEARPLEGVAGSVLMSRQAG